MNTPNNIWNGGKYCKRHKIAELILCRVHFFFGGNRVTNFDLILVSTTLDLNEIQNLSEVAQIKPFYW